MQSTKRSQKVPAWIHAGCEYGEKVWRVAAFGRRGSAAVRSVQFYRAFRFMKGVDKGLGDVGTSKRDLGERASCSSNAFIVRERPGPIPRNKVPKSLRPYIERLAQALRQQAVSLA